MYLWIRGEQMETGSDERVGDFGVNINYEMKVGLLCAEVLCFSASS